MHYFRHLNQVVFLGFCLTVACWGAASAQTATPTSKSSSGSEGSATTPSRKEDVYQSAKASFDRNDYAGALAYLDQAISLENPASGFSSAQALAGYLHLSERLITRNSETAKRYLAQAAERGDWRAAVVLSGVLLNESLVQTPQMTQRFLERARYFAGLGAKQGDVDADLLLAWFEFNGVGGNRDFVSARARVAQVGIAETSITYRPPERLVITSNQISALSTQVVAREVESSTPANVAILTFSDSATNFFNNGPKTISINGINLDVRPDKNRSLVVVIPEGTYEIKAVVGGFFDMNLPYMECTDTKIDIDLSVGEIRHYFLERVLIEETSCSVTKFNLIKKIDGKAAFSDPVGRKGSKYYSFGIKNADEIRLPTEDRDAEDGIRAQARLLASELARLRIAYAAEDFVRLPSQGAIITKNIATQVELAAKKLTEGDGSPADLICKKLGFKPATKDYAFCRERQARTDATGSGYSNSSGDMPRATRDSEKGLIDRTIVEASDKCRQLGFKLNTPAFGKCVLQLSK
jgi:hypothetical protein